MIKMKNVLPEKYESILTLNETQKAIKLVKDTFEKELSSALNLVRVSAPLFVDPETGLNDNLSGVEKAVSFLCQEDQKKLEVVQSLAKWKRYSLAKYNFEGIYTDMNAIRPFEELDCIHSLYVDQWDWEKRITSDERNEEYLMNVVEQIYSALLKTSEIVNETYPELKIKLPERIKFVSSEELEDKYPALTPKERENVVAKEYGAVFLEHIGGNLKNGYPHDVRAADYDDWNLNGDIIVYNEVLNSAFEISSMGIRVDALSMENQLNIKHEEYKKDYPFHRAILENKLPLSIGGGIGQSRICMFMSKKAHIGEVQASYWSDEHIAYCLKHNVHLL